MVSRSVIRTFFILFLIVSLIITSFLSTTLADSGSYWHGFKGDGCHSGFVNQKMDRKLAMQWRYFFQGDLLSPIQIYGDSLYFLDRTGTVNSISKLDAAENYRYKLNQEKDKKKQEEEDNRIVMGIDVCEKFVFVTLGPILSRKKIDLTCFLVALDRKTGEKVWNIKYDCAIATPPLVFSNRVYIATGILDATFSKSLGGDLFCYDVDTQEELLDVKLEEYGFYGENLTYADNVLVAHVIKYDSKAEIQLQPKMVAYDAKTGKELWSEAPMDQDRIFGVPSVKDGNLYIMENPYFIFGGGKKETPDAWLLDFDLKTGKLLKKMVIPKENFGYFSPTLAQDAIYVNSFTGSIYSIDYEMDRIYWVKFYDQFSYFTELTSTRNYLYTCLYNGEFLCISKEDGSIIYRYNVGKYGGIPVISGDEIFVSGEVLYCFSVNAKPVLLLEPTSIDFGSIDKGETKQKSFRILYTGLEQLKGKLTSSEPWLAVKPSIVQGNIQTFFASVDTSKMEAGVQEGNIAIETNFGKKTLSIKIEIIIPTPMPLKANIKENGILTNRRNYMILGNTEPLSRVTINSLEIFSDDQGRFSHILTLHEGENKIIITAYGKGDRMASLTGTIILDSIPPLLEAVLSKNSTDDNLWRIQGVTEPDSILYFNEEIYKPNQDGSFLITFEPQENQTKIEIIAEDQAQNKTKLILSLSG